MIREATLAKAAAQLAHPVMSATKAGRPQKEKPVLNGAEEFFEADTPANESLITGGSGS